MILCREEFAKKLNSNIFPGIQGGPLMHVIAAKAVAFKEALAPEFKDYARAGGQQCQGAGGRADESVASISSPAAPTITCMLRRLSAAAS